MLDVVIASAFGRGQWLASELSGKGMKTALVDFSESLGRWTPEDWEGPFGILRREGLKASQLARLASEDYQESADRGYCFWTAQGPIDCMGLLSAHIADQDPAWHAARTYLLEYENTAEADRSRLSAKMASKSFEENWLCQLIHQLASQVYSSNSEALKQGRPLSVLSSLSLRRVSRRGYHQSMETCRAKGVEVHFKSSLGDIVLDAKQLAGLEIKGEWSGALKARYFIWLLSSSETYKLSEGVGKKLFPNGELKPQWAWLRYRIKMELGTYSDVIPNHCVVVPSLYLPWVDENLLILQKSVAAGEWDVWLRVAHIHRFHRARLEELGQKILEHLTPRLGGARTQILEKPLEHVYEFSELGPALWPVFDGRELEKLRTLDLKNITYGGPETWVNLDWSERFASDELRLADFEKWHKQWLSKQGDRSGSEIHAP